MIILEVFVSLLILGIAFLVGAGLQCVQLYVRRRWYARLRLPDPVAYTDLPSFRCDSEIVLRIHSTRPVRIRFRRCGSTQFDEVYTADAGPSIQPARMDHWHGCDWQPSFILPANTLQPGFYQVDIEHYENPSNCWRMCLLLRQLQEPVLVVAPTNTWHAYNDFGGLSNYYDRATPQPLRSVRAAMRWFNLKPRIGSRHWLCAVPLPEQRPNLYLHRNLIREGDEITHIRGEIALIRFLEREKIPYSIISDRDFAHSVSISRARLVIFNTHSEYWAEEMMARLGEMISRGASILFVSGDNMYRKVQFMGSALSVIDMMIPQQEVTPLIGTYSDAYGFNTFAPYRVVDADHWCFEGLDLKEGAEFGASSGKRLGASGGETDKIRIGGEGFRVVAVGTNIEGPAFMVCRDLPSGAFVFSVSSTAFTHRLDDDKVIQALVRNLICRGISLLPGSRATTTERISDTG